MYIKDIESFADGFRRGKPSLYKNKTDKEIFDLLNKMHPELGIPTYEEASFKVAPPIQKKPKVNSLQNIETKPSWVNNWFLTGDFIPDRFMEEGFAGISPEFFRESYNNSMAGMVYKTANGTDKYPVEDYDPSYISQLSQFLVGMATPLDVATMIATGSIGKFASVGARVGFFGNKAVGSFLEKGILTRIAANSPKFGAVARNAIEGGVQMGVGGGSFSAAHALTHDIARQRMSKTKTDENGNIVGVGEVNIRDAMKTASDEFLHSLPVFAIAGGVTSGLMGSLYGYSKLHMTDGSFKKKMAQAVSHPAARIPEESFLFTALPSMLGDEDAPKIGTKEFWKQFGGNTFVIAGMRGVGAFAERKNYDAAKFLKNELEFAGELSLNSNKSFKRVASDLGVDAPKELRDMIRESVVSESNLKITTKEGIEALELIKKMNKNLDDPNYVKKAQIKGTKENKEWADYAQKTNNYSSLLIGGIESVLEGGNPRIRASFEKYFGRKPTDVELVRYKKGLEGWRDKTIESLNWLDDYMNGNWRTSTNGITGGNPGTPPKQIQLFPPVKKPIKKPVTPVKKPVVVQPKVAPVKPLTKAQKKQVNVLSKKRKGLIKERDNYIERALQQGYKRKLKREDILKPKYIDNKIKSFNNRITKLDVKIEKIQPPIKPIAPIKPVTVDKIVLENMKTQNEGVSFAKKTVKQIFRKRELSKDNKKNVVRYIGEMAGLGDNFKIGAETSLESLQRFVSKINEMDKNYILKLPSKVKTFKLLRDSEKIRVKKDVTQSEMKTLLGDLEVPEGNLYRAKNQQLQDFIDIVNTIDDVKKSTTLSIDESVAQKLIFKNKDIVERFKLVSKVKWSMPVESVLDAIGLKPLADKLRNVFSSKIGHTGQHDLFQTKMIEMFGGARKWNKVKEYSTMFDKERYFERLKNGDLKQDVINFIESAIDTKTWKPKNNKNGMFVKEYKKLMKYYENEFIGNDGVLKQIFNRAEYEKYIKDNPVEFIKDNIYVHRRLTKEANKHYDPNGMHFKSLVKSQANNISENLAKEFYEKRNIKYTEKQLKNKADEFYDDAISIAHNELYELHNFTPGKSSPSFMKRRHTKFPEFIKIDGKRVSTYETSYRNTIEAYVEGMSTFLSNAEYFPEFVKIKGYNKTGSKKLLTELKVKDKNLGEWVRKRVEDHLKVDDGFSNYPTGIRLVGKTTQEMAKFQLSFATSGLKNILMATTQLLGAHRLRDFAAGFFDVIHKDNRHMVRATGATQVGMRDYQFANSAFGKAGKLVSKVGDVFFTMGGMRPSENFARYWSVMVGKREVTHLARRLRFAKEGSRSYNKAVNILNKRYRLDSGEISLLKKFGLNGVEGFDVRTAGMNRRAVRNLYQKINTYAHVSTQGSTINLFMPDWAGKKLPQAALLYKRMAYAATVNTQRNVRLAFQNGSYLRPIMYGLGAYASGHVLLQVFDKLLGQRMPSENSDEGKFLKTVLWKGEFLGILAEVFNPYMENGMADSMYPAVTSTIATTYNTMGAIAKGEEFVGKGFLEILKGSSGLIRNTEKLYKQGLYAKDSYPSQARRYRGLYYDMIKEYNDKEEISAQNNVDMNIKRTKYMQAFRNVFESGYSKDLSGNSLGKWYMMALFAKANDLYYRKIDEDGHPILSMQQAMKKSQESMNRVVRNLNPNKTKITSKTLRGIVSQGKRDIQYRKWLDRGDENLSEGLKKLENQYGYRYESLRKSIKEYIKSNNLEKDLKSYGIKIADLLYK